MRSARSMACNRSKAGISATQGGHQVAHRLITKPCPAKSASVVSLPSPSVKVIGGGGAGFAPSRNLSSPFAAHPCRDRPGASRVDPSKAGAHNIAERRFRTGTKDTPFA